MIASICAARYGAQQADTARRAAWPAIYEGDFRLNPPIASGSGPKRFELEAFFSNEGSSIAIIKERAIGWVAEKSLPAARPSFAATISERTGLGVPSTNSRRNLFQTERGKSIYIDLTAEQIQQINSRDKTLWIFGVIKYADWWGGTHEVGFCKRWVPASDQETAGTAECDPNPTYLYRRDNE